MARLSKPELLAIFERAVEKSGWSILFLSRRGQHPARYEVYRDNRSYRVRLYIWNLTHGGGRNRPADEWRIQVTGIDHFEPELAGKTLILGWWDEVRVFAGFDLNHHSGTLGSSPSIQLREDALHKAAINGFAPSNKGNGELAIAFRPDFLGTYIENLSALHECGEAEREVEVLNELADNPASVSDSEIVSEVGTQRRFAIISTKRALRDLDFRDRVLTAYGRRCAICGLQLRLIEGAHVLPANQPDSTDETHNGVALCVLHHRAYDRMLVTFSVDYRVHVSQRQVQEMETSDEVGGLPLFKRALRPVIHLPPDKRDRPHPKFITAANRLRGWSV